MTARGWQMHTVWNEDERADLVKLAAMWRRTPSATVREAVHRALQREQWEQRANVTK